MRILGRDTLQASYGALQGISGCRANIIKTYRRTAGIFNRDTSFAPARPTNVGD